MRKALLLVALATGCARTPAPAYLSIDADALATVGALTAEHHAKLEVLEIDHGVAVVAIDPSQLEELSERMHDEHARCGGFMVHDSMAEAHAALAAPAVAAAPIEYTLDRAAAVGTVLPMISPDAIHKTIGELSAMRNRYFRSESGAAASLWLRDRWRALSPRTDVTIELVDHGYPQKSVIMTIPGTTLASEVVVIGGHLDSISPGGSSGHAPGADDDASGIATLTEVARTLLASGFRPARTVMFMAYAAEEVGLRGSLSIVKDFQQRHVNVVGALQLDMTNYQGSNRDIWLIDDHTSHAQNAFLVKLIESYVGATWGVDRCGYACSDHASWHRAGIPASMPFESRFRESNREIHTTKDTLEMSGNNAQHAAKFARLGAAYALELAKGTLEPVAATVASPVSTPVAPDPAPSRWPLIASLLGLIGLAGLTRRVAR
ncbi:MAG: M20/M25/M40 family metallo-hydrolase [Myxococcales bacterium]|nr:M20/M25/M40 family metallo-hydrolase [Myxococcales bacterium]